MAKKKRNRKSVVVTSCILAALIVAGSTFAWFTSQDEVTNRLTATANYGTAIAEDFTPPENLLPGQKVNKDVSVVNTGNIDALVKVHLTGAMNILKENAVTSEVNLLDGSATIPSTAVTDPNLTKLGLTLTDGEGNYFRTLSKVERDNPKNSSSDNNESGSDGKAEETNATDEVNRYSEVESVQAGGYLAYTNGAFKFTPETAGYTYTESGNSGEVVTLTETKELTSADILNTWDGSSSAVGLKIDSDTFTPTATGLYIFRRNVTESNKTNEEGTYYEYSGYYYVQDTDTYYALHYLPNGDKTYKSDYVIYSTKGDEESNGNHLTITYETSGNIKTPVVSVKPETRILLFSASYTRVENVQGTYSAATTSPTSKPAQVVFDYESSDAAKRIKVVANLANINNSPSATEAETWSYIPQGGVPYFFYNNDLEEGDSTSKLVDSVELDSSVKKTAYLALDFDLNVVLDSVQITYDESGNEKVTAANESWTDSTATEALDKNEISFITWAEKTI